MKSELQRGKEMMDILDRKDRKHADQIFKVMHCATARQEGISYVGMAFLLLIISFIMHKGIEIEIKDLALVASLFIMNSIYAFIKAHNYHKGI